MVKIHRPAKLVALLVLAAVLGGCAGVIRLDNDVTSYATWPVGKVPESGDTYRFERLPSQREGEMALQQNLLEQLTRAALTKAGLQLAGDQSQPAKWSVQVSARSVKMPYAPWDSPYEPWPGWGFGGRGYVVTGNGRVVWTPMFMDLRPPYYQREISLLIRNPAGQVTYETRAAHDGPWHNTEAMWSALLDAALQGFPRPPSGPRRVVIEVPR